MNAWRLHLASASPRRRAILAELGIDAPVISTGVDDGALRPPSDLSVARRWPAALAYLKARAGWSRLSPEGRVRGIVLGADTIVFKAGAVIGQAADESDARRIIQTLRGGTHEVITGVALVHGSSRDVFIDRAGVEVGRIDDAAIERYIQSGGWRGKAGAYNLSERLAEGWPITFEGDPATIMGLPARLLPARLERFSEYLRSGPRDAHGPPADREIEGVASQ